MGDYCHLTRLIAHDDLPGADRAFMQMLWENVYSKPGWAFVLDDDLRQPVHDRLHLPGTLDDWELLYARKVDGRLYWIAYYVARTLQPPFPRWFRIRCSLEERVPCRALWHALFSDLEAPLHDYRFCRPLAEARDRFCDLSFMSGLACPFLPTLRPNDIRASAPEGSELWHGLRRYLSLFPKSEWTETLRLLMAESGPNALLELSFGEEFAARPLTPAAFQQRHRDHRELFAAFAQGDLTAVARSPILEDGAERPEVIGGWTTDEIGWTQEGLGMCEEWGRYLLTRDEQEQLGLVGLWTARQRLNQRQSQTRAWIWSRESGRVRRSVH